MNFSVHSHTFSLLYEVDGKVDEHVWPLVKNVVQIKIT